MIRSTNRILTTHAGALPCSSELRHLVLSRAEGRPHDGAALAVLLRTEVAEVVRKQIACGIDSVNDGELGKTNFTNYVRERIAGIEMRDNRPGVDPAPFDITARDLRQFPLYFGAGKRSEEHTSELQSRLHLVCRLLLEKKKTKNNH